MTNENEKAEEITCPKCERVWPVIAEQGIVTELYNKCYSCVIGEVITLRDARSKDAAYVVENCGLCSSLEPARQECTPCDQKGWVITPKKADHVIQLIH